MQSKPLRPVIDRSHPLARGLTFAAPLGWTRGSLRLANAEAHPERDLVSGTTALGWGAAAAPARANASGMALALAPTNDITPNGLAFRSARVSAASNRGPCSMYVLATSAPATASGGYPASLGGSVGGSIFGVQRNYSTGVILGVRYSGGGYESLIGPVIASGVLFHTLLVYDGTTLSMYVNGVSVGAPVASTRNLSIDAAAVGNYYLASSLPAGSPFTGTVSDVRVWNRALSAEDARSLYEKPWEMYRTPKFKAAAPFAPEPVRKAGYYRRGVGKVKPVRPVLNKAHPLARGLVSAFSMSPQENLAGASQVVSRDLANGSLITRYGFATNTGPTKWGRGVSLDGGGAEGLLCNSSLLNTITGRNPFSMSAHVWRLTAASEILIVNTGTLGTGVCGLSYSAGLGGFLFNRYRSGISQYALATATPPVSAHLVGTYDGVTSRIYVDGVLRGTVASNNNINNITSVSVGLYVDSGITGISCAATVADARVWNRCLSPSEVASLYSDPWALYRPPGIQVVSSLQDEVLLPPVGTRRGGYTRRKGGA